MIYKKYVIVNTKMMNQPANDNNNENVLNKLN